MGFDISKMDLTPVQVYWKPNGATAEVDLGGTLGNVKVAVGYDKADIKADQVGTTVIDKRISGAKFLVTTEVTQVNDYTVLSYLFPSASAVGTAPSAIQWNNSVGTSDLLIAGQLRLHPQNLAADNKNNDWLFYVACPTEVSEVTYGPTEQSRLKIDWTVYPDTSVTPYRFCRHGNTDV